MSKIQLPSAKKQAIILSNYLINRRPTKQMIELFIKAQGASIINVSDKEIKTLSFVFKHPRSIIYMDSYFALARPSAILRRRLYLMFSILEVSPIDTKYFLAQKRSVLYIFIVPLVCTRAIYRSIIGFLIVNIGRL